MSSNHRTGNVIAEVNQQEHEGTLEPATKRVLIYGFDGTSKQILKVNNNGEMLSAGDYAVKVTTSGTDTYVGEATPGSLQASAVWRSMKVDTNGSVTWADGDTNFNNVATDLVALTYS